MRVNGSKAHVIFANPSGVNCNGCSFSNIDHVTLVSGTPTFDNDRLNGFNVQDGEMAIGSKGLQSNHDVVLLANSIKADGTVEVGRSFVFTGNKIGYDTKTGEYTDHSLQKVTEKAGLVVSGTGGMYANKIYISSENNNIINKGSILAKDVYIKANKIYNQGGRINDTYESPDNKGDFKIFSNKLFNGNGEILTKDGDVNIQSKESIINNGGKINAGKTDGVLIVNTKHFSNEKGNVSGYSGVKINATEKVNNKEGNIYSNDTGNINGVSITTGFLDNSSGSILSPDHTSVNAQNVNNYNGNIFSNRTASVEATNKLINVDGKIHGDNGTHVEAHKFNNFRGSIHSEYGDAEVYYMKLLRSAGTVSGRKIITNDPANNSKTLYEPHKQPYQGYFPTITLKNGKATYSHMTESGALEEREAKESEFDHY